MIRIAVSFGASKEPVSSPHGGPSQRALDTAIIEFEGAIVEWPTQGGPPIGGVNEHFAQLRGGRFSTGVFFDPFAEFFDEWLGIAETALQPLRV